MANNSHSWNEIEDILTQQKGDPNVSTSEYGHQAASMVQSKVENFYDKASGVINKIITVVYSFERTIVKLNEVELERRKAILSSELDYAQQVIGNSMKTITGGFTKTANQLAFENTRMMQENVLANVKMQNSIKAANLSAQIGVKTTMATIVNGLTGAAVAVVDTVADTTASLSSEAITGIASMFGDKTLAGITGELSGFISGNLAGMSKTAASAFATALNAQMQLDIEQKNLQLSQMRAANEITEKLLQQAQSMLDPWLQLVQTTQETWMKVDTASRKLAITMGYYGNQGEAYTTAMMAMGEHMGEIFGKNVTDLIEAQRQYGDASERNVLLGLSGQEVIAGTERLFGMSQGEAAQLYGGMNVFNTSIDSAGDMMQGMYHTITKMGLSASKFSKDLVNNLQLAQKYNFKGGVENMMKLTQWANQTRFNLQSATSFSDKLTSANLSDALETSAKLQVLGGSAAIYSDPLGMLYDAGADVGDMAHRMANMFNDLTGTFNKRTGETEFSWYENYMIKQRAAALGMDDKEVKNMIRQNNKQGIINRELKGYGLDDETKRAIGNRATYNQKEGRWEVKTLDNKTLDMRTLAEHPEMLQNILPEDNEEAMLAVAQKSLGYEERMLNVQKAIAARIGVQTEDINKAAISTQTEDYRSFYNKNMGNIVKTYGKTTNYMTEANRRQLELSAQVFGGEGEQLLDNIMRGFLNAMQKVGVDDTFYKAMVEFPKDVEALNDFVMEAVIGKVDYNQLMKETVSQIEETSKNIKATGEKLEETSKNVFDKMWDKAKGWFSGDGKDSATAFSGLSGAVDTTTAAFTKLDKSLGDLSKRIDSVIPGNGTKSNSNTPTVEVNSEDGIGDFQQPYTIHPDPKDQFMFAKSGGPIDILFKGIFGEIKEIGSYVKQNGSVRKAGSNDIKIQVAGEIKLNENGRSYNILDDIKTKDLFARQLASELAAKMTSELSTSASSTEFNWGAV